MIELAGDTVGGHLTVRRLIGLLSSLPEVYQDIEVVVDGYEGGTCWISEGSISIVRVDELGGREYCGDYGDINTLVEMMGSPRLVYYISRDREGEE